MLVLLPLLDDKGRAVEFCSTDELPSLLVLSKDCLLLCPFFLVVRGLLYESMRAEENFFDIDFELVIPFFFL